MDRFERFERRAREAQRHAVARFLPDEGQGSILRMASGEVMLYDEGPGLRRPTDLRAVVMPDGDVVEFVQGRFRRR